VLAMVAALSWAVYALVLKRLNHTYSTLFITRKSFFYGVVTALPVLALTTEHTPLATLQQPAVWGNILTWRSSARWRLTACGTSPSSALVQCVPATTST